MRALVLVALTAVAAVIGWQRPAARVTFADSEFVTADWSLTVMRNTSSASANTWQEASGGNSGAYRRVYHTLPAASPSLIPQIVTIHLRRDAVYDPTQQGAIRVVCYEEDAFIFEGFGQGQNTGAALKQGDRYFISQGGITGMPAAWQHRGPWQLTAADFIEVTADAQRMDTNHPDFSATGAAITAGFLRSNTSRTGGYILDGAIDNWSFVINCDEPLATPTATATSTPTPTRTSTLTPTATSAPPTASPTAVPQDTPSWPMCVCPEVLELVPQVVIQDAMTNPARYYGWRYPLDPGKPPSPANPPRECLTLPNTTVSFHPLWNRPLWKVGCH